MRRLARFLLLIPIAVIVVVLSVANRAPVTFSFDPFNTDDPALAVQLPMYWLIFAVLAVGILVGGLATWLGQTHWRRDARVRAAELAKLRQEAGPMRADAAGPRLPAMR